MATVIHGDFEWEADKASTNRRKHAVSFEEATTIFADPNYVLTADAEEAQRFLALGMSGVLRLLLVVHVERGRRIRLISARKATNHEARTYEKRRFT